MLEFLIKILGVAQTSKSAQILRFKAYISKKIGVETLDASRSFALSVQFPVKFKIKTIFIFTAKDYNQTQIWTNFRVPII